MDSFEEYYIRAVKFLSIRPRSVWEVRENLSKKHATEEVIEQVLKKLRTQKYIDDSEFVRWWIRQRSTFRPKSFYHMKAELSQKGVGKEIIDSVFSEEDDERTDEVSMAKKIIEKNVRKYKDLPKQDIYTKLGGLLTRRGFSYSVSKRAIDDILK